LIVIVDPFSKTAELRNSPSIEIVIGGAPLVITTFPVLLKAYVIDLCEYVSQTIFVAPSANVISVGNFTLT
jgi:hypothetical protein